MLGQILAKCFVHGLGIVKGFGHIWSEEHDVRASPILLEVLAPNASRCGSLFRNVVVFPTLTHIVAVQRRWPVARR